MKKRQTTGRGKRQTTKPLDDVQEKIRRRAYELYELRGREEGRDWDDWLKAESEVTAKAARQ